MAAKKIRTTALKHMKQTGHKIVMLTAYDYVTARLVDEAEVDVILVGDSLGDNVLGYPSTIPVTLGDMIHHCAAVARGAKRALLIGDMPFMTYKIDESQALRNSGRMIQEGGMEAVKLEGGEEIASTVSRLVDAGIPVLGHIGLRPQSVHQLGGYRIQGREVTEEEKLHHDARCLEQAGAFAVVLEMVTAEVSRLLTQTLAIPTIGIGSGPDCDGQVLVLTDVLGLNFGRPLKLAKAYVDGKTVLGEAIGNYSREVREGRFPTEEQTF